jgi:hypothetical protein
VRGRDRSRYQGRIEPVTFLDRMAAYGARDAWDFTSNTYLRAGVIGPSGITFTRASAAYAKRSDGIWQSFGSGVARITDKGLLIEGSRINRALYSRDLTNPAWTATNVTVARNQVGIDGTANSACSLTATAGNGTVLQAVTNASTGRYFSIWVKRIIGTGTVEVTLDNGSTWTAVTVTAGWTRVGAAQTLANPTVGVRIVTSGDAIAVDFAQLEDGAFPSSPIFVEGTAVTRAADIARISGVSGLAYPLSLFGRAQFDVDSATNRIVFQAHVSGSDNNRAMLRIATNRTTRSVQTASGSEVAAVNPGVAITTGTAAKIAGRFELNNVNNAVNGTVGTADTSAAAPSSPTMFSFGVSDASTDPTWSYLMQVAVIPSALTNAQLQAITT